jgi:hypothetical protein
MEGSLRYGPVSGFVQTPLGGAPGTTSRNRPTFRELNIDEVLSPEASIALSGRGNSVYGGANILRLGDEHSLSSPLVSHGTAFPAGTPVRSDFQLDSYRIGYQYRLSVANQAGTTLSFSPGFGAALLDFDYHLSANGGLSAARSYFVGTPQISLETEWVPEGRLSAAAGVFSSLPEAVNLFILSAQVTGRYRLWGHGERSGMVFLGVGYDSIDYKDNQPVPNHIKAHMGPLLLFGIKARF